MTQAHPAESGPPADFDAIIVGAGFAGLYMLHSLRTMGLSVRVYEQGGGVGGTWYWNRYPGARCDSESVYYMFSDHLSEEILGEWSWSERYAAQPEILRYLEFVTDKMDLRRNIQFNAKVISAVYDSERNSWDLRLEDGSTSSARFLVTAVGCLSSTNTPEFPGIETFGGESYHTGAWPHEGVDRDNVTLLDVRGAPIEEISPRGVRTGGREYEVDAIVFATGFDAMTGALFGMGITGRDGLKLQDKWEDGPRTHLGLTTHGFPNLFVITGPQSPSVLSNMPVVIEQNVEWIAGVIDHMGTHGLDVAEPAQDAEDRWVEHHNEVAAATLLLGTDSWWVGANIPGKPRTLYPYVGGVGTFRVICHEVAEKGYEGLVLARHER